MFDPLATRLLMLFETVVATESYVAVAGCYLSIYAIALVLSGPRAKPSRRQRLNVELARTLWYGSLINELLSGCSTQLCSKGWGQRSGS